MTVVEAKEAEFYLDESASPVTGRIDFLLKTGECILINNVSASECRIVSDILLGLARPLSGAVLFRGKSWQDMSYENQISSRGIIKILYQGTAFLNNLDLIENITLSELHHTLRSADDILNEACKIAGDCGITHYLNFRPYECSQDVLIKARMASILTGNPSLFIIENPLQLAQSEKKDYFTEQIIYKMKNGVSVIITGNMDSVPAALQSQIIKQVDL